MVMAWFRVVVVDDDGYGVCGVWGMGFVGFNCTERVG